MKQYFLKLSGAALLLGLLVPGAYAQQVESDNVKSEKQDLIIVRPKVKTDVKVTIEVKDGNITVNGKPLSEFNDDKVNVTKRKTDFSLSYAPRSVFRSGTTIYRDQPFAFAMDGGTRAFLGVSSETTEGGVRITEVTEGSAADKAGLKEGDIITRVNDDKIANPEDLSKAVIKHKPEEKINVYYKRDGKEHSQSVALGRREMSDDVMHFNPQLFNVRPDRNFNITPGAGDQVWMDNKARLGVKAQETEDGKGVKVLDVDDDSPADDAGIKEGDVITQLDGKTINNIDDLRVAAHSATAKPSFNVKVLRDGKEQEIQVKIPQNLKTINL